MIPRRIFNRYRDKILKEFNIDIAEEFGLSISEINIEDLEWYYKNLKDSLGR